MAGQSRRRPQVLAGGAALDQLVADRPPDGKEPGHPGQALGSIPFGFFEQPYEVSLATTYWGSVTELMEVIALAEAGRIRATVERYPFTEVEKAYAALHERRVHGRAVVVP